MTKEKQMKKLKREKQVKKEANIKRNRISEVEEAKVSELSVNPRYRGLNYKLDTNRYAKRFIKYYRKKIGYQLSSTINTMLRGRGKVILMIANAGGGKTYCILQEMSKLSMEKGNENVRYVIAVPNRNQSNQNEKSLSLAQFGAKSVVGSKDGKKKVEVNTLDNKLYSCVYDKALDLVEILKSNGHEVVLVLDESHKMIADANFRAEAIDNLEEASRVADQCVMMTATPRKCLSYYEYDEIYTLVDECAQANIGKFNVILSEENKLTLLSEIKRYLNMTAEIVVVEEKWEDTQEIVTPKDLFEYLQGKQYETVKRKTETHITSKKVPMRVLVRLNSIAEIEKYIEILKEAGIKAEKLTRKEKDGEVFKSIEEQSKIFTNSQVIFCTSIVECGVSLENQDICLIEMTNSAKDFNPDNTIQFFARPRLQISEATLILVDYINKDIRARVNKMCKNDIMLDKEALLKKELKDFSMSRDAITDEKSLKEIKDKIEALQNKFLELTNKKADKDLMKINAELRLYDAQDETAKFFLKEDIHNNSINNYDYMNVVKADLEYLIAKIDTKRVVEKSYRFLDSYLVKENPRMLVEALEGNVFYEMIEVKHCNIVNELNDPKLSEQYKNDIEFMKKLNEEYRDLKAMKEDEARELLYDDEFVKLLEDIRLGNIYKENLNEYTDKYSMKDILSFKESSVYEEYLKLIEVFSLEETISLLTHKIVPQSNINTLYRNCKKDVRKQAKEVYNLKKVDEEIMYNLFEENMNIVPRLEDTRYFTSPELNHIIEERHFVKNLNSRKVYNKGLHTKHSVILDVVVPAKTNEKGKMVSIRASKELLLKLNIELVDKGIYQDSKMDKEIKAIRKIARMNYMEADLYSKENIKKLESVYSSTRNADRKMLKEISKVFNVSEAKDGFKINSLKKTFDVASIISQLYYK